MFLKTLEREEFRKLAEHQRPLCIWLTTEGLGALHLSAGGQRGSGNRASNARQFSQFYSRITQFRHIILI